MIYSWERRTSIRDDIFMREKDIHKRWYIQEETLDIKKMQNRNIQNEEYSKMLKHSKEMSKDTQKQSRISQERLQKWKIFKKLLYKMSIRSGPMMTDLRTTWFGVNPCHDRVMEPLSWQFWLKASRGYRS